MKQITAEDVRAVLEAEWESDLPDAVLEVLRRHEGKLLTKRIIPQLPGGEAEWYIRHNIAGMTNLENRSYLRETHQIGVAQQAGVSLLIAHTTTNVYIDTKRIEGMNRSYFDARRERNTLRAACLNSILDLEDMARQLNKVAVARECLKQAETELAALTNYGAPFSPDCYVWNKMSGEE